jgi:pantetheine-phosphate adenylyltransferase
MKIAIYAGSFDPITAGHLWMIWRGSELFDKLIVAVSTNAEKKCMFDLATRISLIKEAIIEQYDGELPNVEVVSVADDYIVTFAREQGAEYLLRGIRSNIDFEYESQIARINHDIANGYHIQSVFLMPKVEVGHVSSSMVKGLIGFNGWERAVKQYVSRCVAQELYYRFSNKDHYRFDYLFKKYGFETTYRSLMNIYDIKDRPYHNSTHIHECIEQFARVKAHLEKPDLVELALAFHDAVYVPGNDDNEDASAKLFLEHAKKSRMPESEQAIVAKLIRSTNWLQNKDALVNTDLHILHDIDFSIFAADWARFLEYDNQIEAEYAHVPKEIFVQHRRDFLNQLANVGVFYTQHFDHEKAKNNIDKILKERYTIQN